MMPGIASGRATRRRRRPRRAAWEFLRRSQGLRMPSCGSTVPGSESESGADRDADPSPRVPGYPGIRYAYPPGAWREVCAYHLATHGLRVRLTRARSPIGSHSVPDSTLSQRNPMFKTFASKSSASRHHSQWMCARESVMTHCAPSACHNLNNASSSHARAGQPPVRAAPSQ